MKKIIFSTAIVSILTACAPSPDRVSASYVSPVVFEGQSCKKLMTERNKIASDVNLLTAEQRKSSTNDAWATGVALVLFWPAAFALALTEDQSAQLAQAKGNFDAVEAQMRNKGCQMPTVNVPA